MESRRAGELLVADVGRLRILVDDLMEISRFDAGAERPAFEPVDLGRLIATVAAVRSPEASIIVERDAPTIESDPRRLERIVGNLLDNAREHAAGTPVEIRVQRVADEVVVSVADRGPGVPDPELERIFQRFTKADPSRHGGSSGLGLAIAQEHAALLGGRLTAENRAGRGLRVSLRLPVTGSLHDGDGPAMARDDAEAPIFTREEPIE